ncbi:NUDIX domain-containing protein [Candidatus Parcubacteria bacterium]|nr:NUDIX domain-containing protein [Candidatus Parcubacteria bacterium]
MQKTFYSSAAIIFRQQDPTQLFVEVKDEGYPKVLFRHHIFLFGGGREPSDKSPLETVLRELKEELTVPAEVLSCMEKNLIPYKEFRCSIPKEVFERAGTLRDTWDEIASFFLIPLPEDCWATLTTLQKQYGNLSSESTTTITSLFALANAKISWEVAKVLQYFFLEKDYREAEKIPQMEGVTLELLGEPVAHY